MYKANQQGKYPSFLSALRRTFGVGYSLLGLVALMRVSLTPFDAHNYYCWQLTVFASLVMFTHNQFTLYTAGVYLGWFFHNIHCTPCDVSTGNSQNSWTYLLGPTCTLFCGRFSHLNRRCLPLCYWFNFVLSDVKYVQCPFHLHVSSLWHEDKSGLHWSCI